MARLNLVNMAYTGDQRLEVYAHAQDGLAGLEPNWDKRLKYVDFIDHYAQLSEAEWQHYQDEYLTSSAQREVIMGMLSYSRQEGWQEGEARSLLTFLEARFGPLDEAIRKQVSKMDVATLEALIKRAATADSLEAVFDDKLNH